ncbi:ABC transporter substrate-binding protein [Neobacillus drentensis]|uniref:ABC transporter substrate-binding protein n=1 Tax=Bacillales TaxID=1385 RepID=UPI0025AF940E|nr:ABC transporter substrate-binding protein [Paenibacillus sp. BSR1-1]MDN3017901.1 ABC transporter substrate-binding protein [Paenibacillus sp. BSR1-1]
MKTKLVLTFMLVFALLLAGCSSSSSTKEDESGKVVLKFLHKWPQPEYAPYFEEVVKDFEKQNPNIKIKMEAIADEPIKDKLRVILGGNEVPDIMFSWSGEFARKFVRANAALDLTPYLNEDTAWKNSFIPASLQPFTSDGKNYGIPLRFNGKFFVYNKKIFEKYNLQEPATWDEFLQTLDTLKKGGETPLILGNQDPWAAIHYLTGLNQKEVSQDVRMKDYNPGSGEFTDPGYVKAMELLADLNKKGYFMKNVNSSSHDMAKQLFFAGKGAIMYVELEEFADMDKNMKGNWGFFPMPSIADGKGNQNFITGAPDGFIVSSKTKHPKEAIQFLKFLTSKENSLKLVKEIGWPSPIDGATNPDTALKEVAEGVEAMKKAEGMAEWLDTDVHAKVADVYLSNIQLLLDGSKTPEQIIKEVQKVAKQVQSEVE